MTADPGLQLRSLLMLGMWANERTALDRARDAVPADPTEWTDTGVTPALWAAQFGSDMADSIPAIIEESGLRPREAVIQLVRVAVLYGVEVGRQLERQGGAS